MHVNYTCPASDNTSLSLSVMQERDEASIHKLLRYWSVPGIMNKSSKFKSSDRPCLGESSPKRFSFPVGKEILKKAMPRHNLFLCWFLFPRAALHGFPSASSVFLILLYFLCGYSIIIINNYYLFYK